MNLSRLSLLCLSFATLACQSSAPGKPAALDQAQRESLLSTISSLEGLWELSDPEAASMNAEFVISSAGSAVREIMMPGQPSEMTNMYTLDGNSLVMTHYCAGGNQPRMRATSVTDGRMSFSADGVSDLNSRDEVYMGAMTLVIIDEDHIEQHWRALKDGELDNIMVFELSRVR